METFTATATCTAQLHINQGTVTIEASPRDEITVEILNKNGEPAKDNGGYCVDFSDNSLSITHPKTQKRFALFHRDQSFTFNLTLPKDSTVELQLGAGAATINHDCAQLIAHVGAGDITAGETTNYAELKTGSGNLTIAAVHGNAVTKCGRGNIQIGTLTGTVEANSGMGNITVEFGKSGQLTAKTGMGNITACIAPGTAAWQDASSGLGDLSSDLQASTEPAAEQPRLHVTAKAGMGNVCIKRATPQTA